MDRWIVFAFVTVGFVEGSKFLDLDLELMFKRVPKECLASKEGSPCRIPLAVTLLEARGTYDLETLMLQDGFLTQLRNSKHFKERTVISLPRHLLNDTNAQLFVGVKIFGMPKLAQDYFVLDASKVKMLRDHKIHLTMETRGVWFKAKLGKGRVRFWNARSRHCACQQRTCGCCEHVSIPKIHLNDTACVNITYLPKPEYGVSFTFSIDGRILYNDTFSARNPPPFCFGVPHLKEYASLCIRFVNLTIGHEIFSGCVDLEAELYHVKIAELKLGCFHIPVRRKSKQLDVVF